MVEVEFALHLGSMLLSINGIKIFRSMCNKMKDYMEEIKRCPSRY